MRVRVRAFWRSLSLGRLHFVSPFFFAFAFLRTVLYYQGYEMS